jgi:hypothetical protein
VIEFEESLFGRDRVMLDRVAESCSTFNAVSASACLTGARPAAAGFGYVRSVFSVRREQVVLRLLELLGR